ncbi:hypothetical protein JTE90_015115 [Oedothorax gibbosus]|uniref:DIS3-like exonuclease 2 n=1 Tax=Oedothorax gibbosus TaxID=931172 RepID=A0AAV6VT01_9ARAC|nr:hypothetical protein JTE90_015115 [Oedothorax gibbosus]
MEELELAASKILAEALNGSQNGSLPNSSGTPSSSQPKKNEGAIKKKTPQSIRKKPLNNGSTNDSAEPDSKAMKSKKKGKKADIDKTASRSTDPGGSGTPKQKKPGRPSYSDSNVFSDISAKMNSSDNLRNSKGSRRASLPNHNQGLQGACGNSASKPVFHTPDKNNSKLRSKTPECPNSSNKPQQPKKFTPKKSTKFEPYIPLFKVQQGLKRGEFIEGALRINPRNYEDAYLNSPDGKMDIYIGGMQDRNRALNGDIVAVQINPKQEWRVLCDAIKDYHEKTGECVVETACVPVSSPPCKIHTPDRLSRSRPLSSNSWGSSASGARLPDTLEILGVDKLAQQLEELSAAQSSSKRQKPKRKSKSNQQSKDSTSEKTSASYSQESSEDCLDPKSPMHFAQDLKDSHGTARTEKANTDTACIEKDLETSNSNANNHDSVYPACDMSEIGTFNIDVKQNLISLNPWESERSALNIIVSPEDLLTVDGDSLLNNQIANNFIEIDNSENENNVIIVPPGELSGDEFTDSASVGSTQSEHLNQVIEDAEFLACQQDADNNNVELDNYNNQNIINQVSSTDFPSLNPLHNTTTQREKSIELDCRVQHNQTLPVLSHVEVHSDSVICSGIAQFSIANSSSGENDESNSLVIEEFRAPDNLVNLSQPIPTSNVSPLVITSNNEANTVASLSNKKSRRRKKKKKPDTPVVRQQDANLNLISNDPSTWTVEKIMKHPEWPRFVQKTGKVVHILERKHSCIAAGHLKLFPDKNPKRALFSPNDSRVPRIMVPMSDCPPNFFHRHFDYANYLFLARIVEWNETSTFAAGHLIKGLGNSGDVEAQTEGILVENSVDYEEFPEAVLECLPQEEWKIPKREIERRRDFRQQCIFTIDPATARDMDDAVSCSRLENGNFEVGVHIADVTYFVEPGTLLDKYASERSTSVYLIQKVVPMLPRLLCDNLCSLNPNQDRLTFSVLWEMSPDGQICNQWIGRSIINSCAKLSYEHAQSMIENPINDCFSSEFPEVYGDFSLSDISRRINDLQSLAVKLRDKRFEEGALRLDQVKLQFTLDKETGLPSGYSLYVQRDSNKLIEEFMLLANMTVAEHIYKAFPELSMLRRHPPPQPKLLDDTVKMCEAMGVIIDARSSGTLQTSIAHYMGDDYMSKARTELLTSIFSKPMNCALYFCTGILEEETMFQHYALNVPLYTHFTSPIRRYPDVIVHRLLAASLNYGPPPKMSPNEMEICAAHCNDKKYNAKKVSDQSAEMFLAAFIREIGSVSANAIIVGVMDHSFDCLILDMGIVKRVYCDKLPLVKKEFKRSHGVSRLNIFWKDPAYEKGLEQVIVIFALVDVLLSVEKDSLVIKATLKKPGSL